MQSKITIVGIKKGLDSQVGKKVRIKTNRGRRKVQEKSGILERTYPNVFVIQTQEHGQMGRICYSYSDILTDAVQLSICDGMREVNIRDMI